MNYGEERKMWMRMWMLQEFHFGMLRRYKNRIFAAGIGCAVCDVISPLHPSSSFHINSFKHYSLTSPNIIFISATIITVHKCISQPNASIWIYVSGISKSCDTRGQHHNQAKITTNLRARIVSFGRYFGLFETMSWLHTNKNKHSGCPTDHILNAEHCWNRRCEFLQQIFQLKRKKGRERWWEMRTTNNK